MVLNGNECSNALYNANHRELHVSTLMGFCNNSSMKSFYFNALSLCIYNFAGMSFITFNKVKVLIS